MNLDPLARLSAVLLCGTLFAGLEDGAAAVSPSERYLSAARGAWTVAATDFADRPTPGGKIGWVHVEGMRNVRDIGGWTGLRSGRAFRGTEPDGLRKDGVPVHGLEVTSNGIETVRSVMRIKTDLDLRGAAECPHPARSSLGVDLVRIPVRAYGGFDGTKERWSEALRLFADSRRYPIYFHCWGGADRTGILAMLLEGLCGVAECDLWIDYELTTFSGFCRLRSADFAIMLNRVKARPGESLADKFADFVERELGLTRAEIEDIRSNLMDRNAGTIPAAGTGDFIYNTDGCDVLYWPDGLGETPENFGNRRLRHALGTRVRTVSYCPLSAGFGRFTCRFAGEPATNDVPRIVAQTHNAASAFFAQGTDALQMAVDFCRSNRLEIVVSVRVNDQHDVDTWSFDFPHPLFPKFKLDHPECLMGAFGSKNEHLFERWGTWSCVDFTHKIVRDRMRTFVRELAENYDVDGIEYDFFRHLMLFRSVAEGGVASDGERALMTELMRDLRATTQAVAKRRGRPFRVLMRMPDTVAYCRDCGIDLERWLAEGLLDDWIGGGYFQLASWDEAVAVAHRHGVRFHASMDESRVERRCLERKLPFIPGRETEAAYAARFAQARLAGCDGIYLFNCEQDLMNRVAKLDGVATRSADQLYFATFLGSGDYTVNSLLKNGVRHMKLPRIDPGPGPHGVEIACHRPDERLSFPMWIGDFAASEGESSPRITVRALTNLEKGDVLDLSVNGKVFKPVSFDCGLFIYVLAPDTLRRGRNDFAVTFPPRAGKHRLLDFAVEIGSNPQS